MARLLKTSPINALLMAMYDAQRLTSTLWGINTIRISNTAGDVIIGTSMAFRRAPNMTYAKEGGTVEWSFLGRIDGVLGTY